MIALLDRQVVFFGGKGGVGKTTCSSAFALEASRRGRRVLLVSTDPAHSTSDIFERPIGTDAQALQPNLWAVEIDADREAARYIDQVKRDLERIFSASVVHQARRQIDLASASPGLADVALLDRMIDLLTAQMLPRAPYDLIVFDTAPTGHTLQLLRMPDAMTVWIEALVKHRQAVLEIDQGRRESSTEDADPVIEALQRRRNRLLALRELVTDKRHTAFVLVTIPERLAIDETARAASALADTGLHVAALIVNRVLPDGLTGEFYAARKAQEQEHLNEIARRFPKLNRVAVEQLPRDVHGVGPLDAVARQLV